MAPGKDTASAVLDIRAAAAPGVYNLVLQGTAQTPFNKDPAAKQKPNINVVFPATPIAITILPRQVGSISLSNANVKLKAGTQVELLVKVARSQDYSGEFKVQLVVPAAVKGIASEEVKIQEGKAEAKLLLKAATDATLGNHANLIVRATAALPGNHLLAHDAKLTVNIAK
jgi:hypothetical protein